MRGELSAIRRDGLRIRGKDEDVHAAKVNCYDSTKEIGACDLVLIAVKATSNAEIVDLIPPLLNEETFLLTLQNGLGNEEFLAKNFGAERVLGGLCFICLSRTSRTTIERYDYGHIVLGEYGRKSQKRTHELAERFKSSGVTCSVTDDLALERWRKLVWNIPFNGLSILAGGIDTEAILADESLHQSVVAMMDEVIAAANKCGHQLGSADAEKQMERTETMGAYKPSTLLDFEAGKPLEIEAIWGEPLRRALAAGAPAPRLEIIYSLLKSLDHVRRSS
jgi:2-dehydropantoate 2-reductase